MDLRYIAFLLLIMIKGIFKTGGYLFVTFEHFYHHFTAHGDTAYFTYIVLPQGYHTEGIVSRFEHNFISKVTQLDEDYFCRFNVYKCSPVNYVTS